MDLRQVDYEHPDAVALVAELQQEFVRRYGGPDPTPVDPAEFRPPAGVFLVGYVDDRPVACGGWRVLNGHAPNAPDTPGTPDASNTNPTEATGAADATASTHLSHRTDTGSAHSAGMGDVAEVKRMYVAAAARGNGYARRLLAELEHRAAYAGCGRLVLVAGDQQPEALALYASAGYVPAAAFGYYAGEDGAQFRAKTLSTPAPERR